MEETSPKKIQMEEVTHSNRHTNSLGIRQLGAILAKNFYIKKRKIVNSIFELLSPLLLVGILLMGYNLSSVDFHEAGIYARNGVAFYDGFDRVASILVSSVITPQTLSIFLNINNTVCDEGQIAVASGICAELTPQLMENGSVPVIPGLDFPFDLLLAPTNVSSTVLEPLVTALTINSNASVPVYQFSFNFTIFPPTIIIQNIQTNETSYSPLSLLVPSVLVNNTNTSLPSIPSIFNDSLIDENFIAGVATSILSGNGVPSTCIPISTTICVNVSLTVNNTIFSSTVNQVIPQALASLSPNDYQTIFYTLYSILDNTGPMNILTLDEFASLGLLFRNVAGSSPDASVISSLSNIEPKYNNLLKEDGKIYFSPQCANVEGLVNYLSSNTLSFSSLYGGTFANEEIAAQFAKEQLNTIALVHFTHFDLSTGDVRYIIRMNHRMVPMTHWIVNKFRLGLNKNYQKYWFSGFLSIQKVINDYIIMIASNTTISSSPSILPTPEISLLGLNMGVSSSEDNLAVVPFPTREYNENIFFSAAGPMVGLAIVMSMFFPVSRLIKELVEEKELKHKELLKMMGLYDWVFALGWTITYLIIFTIQSILITIMLSTSILSRSDPSLVFLFFFLFTTSLVPFCFLISNFFSRAKLAAIVGPLVLFAALIPRYAFFGFDESYGVGSKTWTCLLSPTCTAFGTGLILEYEGANLNFGWSSLSDDSFSLLTIIIMLAVDIFLYSFLAWFIFSYSIIDRNRYFDKVLPNMYGIRKSPFFLCQPSYWKKEVVDENDFPKLPSSEYVESIDASVQDQVSVHINEISKSFGEKRAVEKFSLALFRNQITILLGHNGAGKSTLINILTGLYSPTSGSCYIEDMSKIRQKMGVCPQQNILYDILTVEEHLYLYSTLKGVPEELQERSVINMMSEVGLTEKRYDYSINLSGGMKRKLSCAISLIGHNQIIFLDEPTSGMDPVSRRFTWDMLRRQKKGRTIILTTHFMDEADLLGDRIAIMSNGHLQCAGSGIFLKNRFGLGYSLTLLFGESCHPDIDKINVQIHHYVPDAKCISSSTGEIAYQLPISSVNSFPDLLSEIEHSKSKLCISGYGMSMTTLEEVFLKLSQEGSSNIQKLQKKNTNDNSVYPLNDVNIEIGEIKTKEKTNNDTLVEIKNTSFQLEQLSCIKQIGILLYKRWSYSWKDWKGRFFEIILPVIMIAFIMLLLTVPANITGPPMILNSKSLPGYPTTIAYTLNPSTNYNEIQNLNQSPDIITLSHISNDSIDMSKWLLDTNRNHDNTRYGALSYGDEYQTSSNTFFSSSFSRTLLFNTTSEHSLPIFYQELMQSLFRNITNLPNAMLECVNNPLPITERLEFRVKTFLTLFAALFSLVPFCYLPGTFTIFLVKERTIKSKHIQMLTGAHPSLFWISTYIWDILNFFVVVLLCMIVFSLFDSVEFVANVEIAFATIFTLMMYGAAVLPLSYTYSFLFSNHSSAQIAIAGIHFLFGFVLVIASFILSAIDDTKEVNSHLIHIYRIFPTFVFGENLINLATLGFINQYIAGVSTQGVLDWDVTVYLFGEIVVYWFFVFLIEKKIFQYFYYKMCYSPPIINPVDSSKFDADVIEERKKINDGYAEKNSAILLKDLTKIYDKQTHPAVDHLSLSIEHNQVFGLLGINGAGKTTTLSILTGDIPFTNGQVYIEGKNILNDMDIIRKEIGFCPQIDPLLDYMTTYDTLYFYGRLRGVPVSHIDEVINDIFQQFKLFDYKNVPCSELSGGNRRKISLAIIGNPSIILLDEPSSGMDPVSRRNMWDVIKKLSKNHTIILTTHSMEECEVLAQKLAIMAAGNLRCIGTPQHLKLIYGEGYHMEVKIDENYFDEFQSFMKHQFFGAILEEHYAGQLKYRLPKQDLSLINIFSVIEENKHKLAIQDYGLSQSTLEQIFISFAREQEKENQYDP